MKKLLIGIIMTILIGMLIGIGAGGAAPPPGGPAAPTRMFYLSQEHSYGFTGEIYKIEGDIIWLLPQGLEKEDIEYFGERVLLKIVVGEKTELLRINQRGRKEILSLGDLKTDQRITTAVIWKWNGKEATKIQIMEKP